MLGYPRHRQKKNIATSPELNNTSQPLNTGGQLDPVSLINTINATAPLAPVTDKQLRTDIQIKDDAIRQQKLQQQEQLSNNLKKIRTAMPESDMANIDKAINIVSTRQLDRLTAPTKEEQAHNEFMDSTAGKVLGGVAYLGSKATKGTLQIAKGVSHLVELANDPMKFATGQESATDGFFKKADELANYGLTKSDVSNIEEGTGMGKHALAGIGMMAEFAPSIALGEATAAPKAVFYLQGLGQGKDLSDNLKKQGKYLNPLAKEALIQGSGFVNMILSDLGDNLYGKLPSVARGKIATGIVADAIKESAGKDLTYDSFKTLLDKGARTFADKFEKAPLEILNKYNHTAATLGGLNVANFAVHKGVDKINDTPVFNETAGDLAEVLVKTVTQEAPLFTALGAVPEITKLTPYSSYKNDVVESIVHDPSKENVDSIKSQISNHGSEQGWSQEEMAGSLQHIEQIGAATRKLPNTITPDKKSDAVGLIIDRDGLTKKLQQIKDGKKELDPSIKDIPSPQEQYLTDKIEQANDKIRSIVTGKKVTYSKDETNPEKPKFFKTIDGKQENIEQSRYDLENTERQLKTTTNDKPVQPENDKVNTELLPEQQKETSVNVPDETVKPVIDSNQDLVSVNEVLDKPVRYNGEPATIFKDGQTLVAHIDGSNREYELGNADEIGNTSIKELGIEHTKSVVDVNENGNITVRGKEVINNFSDQKQAINYDKDGNVISVNLETTNGKKRTFKGDIAEDIAYEIHLKELNKNNETNQQFEQFIEQHEPSKSAIVARENEVIAEKGTTENNATVSRKPVKKIIKNEQPRPTTDNTGTVEAIAKPIQQPKAKQAAKDQTEVIPVKIVKQSLSDAETQRKAELRKKFSGQLNDITRIPTLLADKEFREYAGLIFKEAAGDFKSFSKELIESVGEKIREHLPQLHKELEKEYAVEAENKPSDPIGITKEETRKQREIRGLENLPDAEKTTLSKMFDEGKEAVQSRQIDPAKLAISVVDKPRNLSPVEVNSLLYDRQSIREQSDTIRGQIEDLLVKDSNPDNLINGSSESMQILQDRQRFLDAALDNNEKALRAGANQNALALVAMQNMINADYTLSEQRSRMRVKAGGELTKDMEAELERYDKELKEAKAQVEDYQNKLKDKLAKEEIKKAQTTARASKKTESKEVIQAERKAIVDDFKAHWEKIRKSSTLSSDIPYRRELTEVTVYMVKMLGNLTKEGIVEFRDVIDKIHDEFKDAIENLTKDDVRDVLAGTYRERKESKNDLLEQKNAILRIAKLTKQIEDLKNGVKTEKKESRLVKKRNAIVELENEVKTLKSQARIEDAANLEKESLKRRLENLNERIKNEDFEKPQGRPKVEADAESITLTAKLRKAQNNFDAMAQRLGSHTESNLDKTLSTIQQVRRFMLLSGVKTLGKLYAFAADRTVTTPVEELANTLNSKLPFLRKIAQRSPRFSGGIDPKAESTAIITRISKATLKDSWIDVLKTGVGELDRVYGKHGVDKDFDLNPSALEFFGRLHGAFKNSTKRAEFFRSYQKRLQHAAENGRDINDPNIQYAIGGEAYADGKRAILMNDNILVDKGYKSLLRGLESGDNNQAGKVFAAVVRGLFPIVKIPANYVVESFDVATLGARAIPKIIQAMVKGADSLSPKEADMVMRTIAKGQIGLALMMYAYANPKMFGGYYSGKRKDDDLKAGDIIIGGYHLPHWMAHNPYFEAMQMAATMRRAIDTANGNGAPEGIMNQLTTSKRDDLVSMAVAKSDKHNPDSQLVEVQDGKQLYQVYLKGNNATSIVKEGGIKQGINTAAKGLLEQIPFTSIGDMMSSTSSPSTFAGSVVKNLTEPRFVQEISEWTDRKNGEMVKRDPQGFVEQLKSGIPGLRQYVTEKEVKQDKKVSTIRIPASDGEPETVLQLPPDIIAEREKINQQFLKDKESIIRAYFKAYRLTEHDIQRRLKDVSNDYSAPIIYQKYKDKLKPIED